LIQPSLANNCDVIVVNYNAGQHLTDCVLSVLSEVVTRRVFVIDNDSHDESLKHLEKSISDNRLYVIRNGKNLGFATACNVGAHASDADTLLFLNPDSVLTPGALQRMMHVLENGSSIGMVGGFLCNPDGSEQPGGRRVFPTPRRAFIRAFGLSRFGRWFPDICSDYLLYREAIPTFPTPVEAISGACMLVKTQAVKEVGLWDEKYFLHCEDLDWCMRFKQKGWEVVFVPEARVIHMLGVCSRSRPFFVEWHKHRGMLIFYNKFFRKKYPGVFWGLVKAGVWLRFSLLVVYHTTQWIKTRFEVMLAKISGWRTGSNQYRGAEFTDPIPTNRLADNSIFTK